MTFICSQSDAAHIELRKDLVPQERGLLLFSSETVTWVP